MGRRTSRWIFLPLLPALCLGAAARGRAGLDYAASTPWQLADISDARAYRASGWDASGGNRNCNLLLEPWETRVLADVKGRGCIRYVGMATTSPGSARL